MTATPAPRLTSFVGRAALMDQICQAIGQQRLVSLIGSGGVGKTRLAEAVVAAVAADGGTEVGWVELAPVADPGQVVEAIARSLGVQGTEGDAARLAAASRDRSLLLAIDNAEHVIDEVARAVEVLIATVPGLHVLVTSREVLAVPGETIIRVPPLDMADARALFAERAGAGAVGRPVDPDDAAVGRIVERLDAIPLALELAAARCRALSPDQIAEGLDDRFGLLTSGARTALPRQQTLEESVGWSVDLLDDDLRGVLHALSVFAGTFTIEAAEHVASAGTSMPIGAAVLDLVDRSLLIPAATPSGRPGFRMLETVRAFARRTAPPQDLDVARTAHVSWCLELAAAFRLASIGPDAVKAFARIDHWLDDIREAIARAEASADATDRRADVLALWTDLGDYWPRRGLLTQALDGLSQALDAAHPITIDWMRAALSHEVLRLLGGTAGMSPAFPRLLDAEPAAGGEDILRVARLMNALHAFQKPPTSPPADVLGDFSAITDPWCLSFNWAVGWTWAMWDAARSLPVITELLQEAARSGSLLSEGILAELYAIVGPRLGHVAAAEGAARRAIEIAHAVGERRTEAQVWAYVAEPAILRGDYGLAREALDAAASVPTDVPPEELDYNGGIWHIGLSLAIASGTVTDHQVDHGLRGGLAPTVDAWLAAVRGLACAHLGRHDEAVASTDDAIAHLSTSLRWLVPQVHLAQARVRRICAVDGAAEAAHDAVESQLAIGHVTLPDGLEEVALAEVAAGRHERAVRLLGAAAAMRERLGTRRWACYDDDVDEALATARGALGEEAADAAWDRGRELTDDDAVALARTGRDERPVTGWDSLTPAEQETARLAAEGLSNPAIAERLFISRNTVKTHLSAAYRKLAVANRTELAASITEQTGPE